MSVAAQWADKIGHAELIRRAQHEWGIKNATLANQILKGQLPVGNLSLEQKEKVLDNVFGRGFSTYMKTWAREHGVDYEKLMHGFDNLKVTGTPGQLVAARGLVSGKQALIALGDFYGEKGFRMVDMGMEELAAKAKAAEITIMGAPQADSRLMVDGGGEVRIYDLGHAKYETYLPMSWSTHAKELQQLEKQALKDGNLSLVGLIEHMKQNPDEAWFFHYHITRSGKPFLTHAYRGSDWQQVDLGRKLGKQDIQIGDYTIKGVTADTQQIHGMKVYKNLAMNTFQLGQMAKILAAQGREEEAAKVWRLIRKMVSTNTHAAMGELVVDEKGNVVRFVMGNEVIVEKKSEFSATDVTKDYAYSKVAKDGRIVEQTGEVGGKAVVTTTVGKPSPEEATVGGVRFVSFDEKKQIAGGLLMVSGLTDQGQYASLIVNPETGQIISSVYQNLRQYQGALAMAQNEAVPEAVFQNKVDAAAYATMLSNELRNMWRGEVSSSTAKLMAERLNIEIGGGGSLKFLPISIRAAFSHVLQAMHENSKVKSTDLVTAYTFAIATDPKLSDAEKLEKIKQLTDWVMEQASETSEEMPKTEKQKPSLDVIEH